MKKTLKLILKIIIAILLIFVGLSFIRILFGLMYSNVSPENNFVASYLHQGNEIKQRDPDELLFLFTGVDSTGENTGTRTDTMMLVLANKKLKKIDIISIPRDTRVNINGNFDKINAAHSYGAMPLTLKTVRELMGIDIDYFIQVSFQSVIDGVDALGGIEIDVDEKVANAMNMNSGLHTFNGKDALWYVRFRKGYIDADLGRINTQQNFIKEFVKQSLKFTTIYKLPRIYKAVSKNMETNIPFSTLLSYSWSFRDIDSKNIETHLIEGYPEIIDGVSYYIPNEENIRDIRNNLLYNY